MKIGKIKRKLQKTYIKTLYSYANHLQERARKLEDKMIELELRLKEKRDED